MLSRTVLNSDATGLVDAHCHVDLFDNPAEIVRRADDHRVYTIAVTNAPSVFSYTEALVKDSRYVRPALGLHPELVKERAQELSLFLSLLSRTRYIGEVGLDYTTGDMGERAAQRRVFDKILEGCTSIGDKVLTIHSRRAVPDVLACLKSGFRGKAILHWFSGSARQLEAATSCDDVYFSVNSAMLHSSRRRALVERMPPDKILTETDAPFVRIGMRPAEPADVRDAVAALAGLWKVTPEEVRARIFQNFRAVLSPLAGASARGKG